MPKRVVCFGEILLRLSAPGRETLLQSPSLQVHVGGAEANVAVALARFGHSVAMVSTLPDNPLGAAAIGELRRHGIATDSIALTLGRMGNYFYTSGAGHRPSEVLYDRADSAFARAGAGDYDWPTLIADASVLHLSGITPALGSLTRAAALAAARAARAAGALVSFDGNYRAKLWACWDGDPQASLHALLAEADIAFADHRDIALVLGGLPGIEERDPRQRFEAAAQAAFAAFPNLQRIATTVRVRDSTDHHRLGAMLASRDGSLHVLEEVALGGIVDRIGTGDAFAAGVLHGILEGMDDGDSLAFGRAAGCLKHYVPGDFNLVSIADVMALVNGDDLDVRR